MSRWLVDTNVALRWSRTSDAQHRLARRAVERLGAEGEDLLITPQVVIEFWNVATRPVDRNGLGLAHTVAIEARRQLERFFPLAPDTEGIYPVWRQLVETHQVAGVQVHDARLAAVMIVHGLSHILTFNAADFARYEEITAVHPAEVLAAG